MYKLISLLLKDTPLPALVCHQAGFVELQDLLVKFHRQYKHCKQFWWYSHLNRRDETDESSRSGSLLRMQTPALSKPTALDKWLPWTFLVFTSGGPTAHRAMRLLLGQGRHASCAFLNVHVTHHDLECVNKRRKLPSRISHERWIEESWSSVLD